MGGTKQPTLSLIQSAHEVAGPIALLYYSGVLSLVDDLKCSFLEGLLYFLAESRQAISGTYVSQHLHHLFVLEELQHTFSEFIVPLRLCSDVNRFWVCSQRVQNALT